MKILSSFIVLFLLLGISSSLSMMVSSATVNGDDEKKSSTNQQQERGVVFPDAFIVSTGTTIPLTDSTDPISQSGQIFFDLASQKMRIDHNWMGNRRSFIVDLEKERGFLLTNTDCVTSKISGKLLPMSVPAAAMRSAEMQLVRHVPVYHFQSFERADNSLNQLDYYVRHTNLTAVLDDGSETGISFYLPWRSESRRSDRRELAAPPHSRPNWRFFGEEIDEQLVPNFENRVARVLTRDVVVTVDYYDFVPIRPDASTFEPPGQCKEEQYSEHFAHDVDVHEAQRLLTELSFNTEAGKRVVEEINNQAKRRRIADEKHHQQQEEIKEEVARSEN